MAFSKIHLKVMVPERIVVDHTTDKVIAESPKGFFCLKPRHIDFAAALCPGILYSYQADKEFSIAVDEGTLVKCGEEVLVSVVNAIQGDNLEDLENQVREKFLKHAKKEEASLIALRNLEADLIRRFIKMEKGIQSGL